MSTNLALDVYEAIAAVAPIVSVSIGSAADKTTWKINFTPAATAAQQTAAIGVITNFNLANWNINQAIYSQITALEAATTTRHIREAALGTDGGWLKALDVKIAALRATLIT